MNTLPEWFTVEKAYRYQVTDQRNLAAQLLAGETLRQGIPVQTAPSEPLRLTVLPQHP